MFSWNLAKKVFDAFTILRWTDFIKPLEYVQMEKCASQAVLSYIIGKEYEEQTHKTLNWEFIVKSNIYGLLCKIATSDIKSTISNKIKVEHLNELKNYIISVFFDNDGKCRYDANGVIDKSELETYILESNNRQTSCIEYDICYIAHKFATYREFCHIKIFNSLSPDTTRVENEINPIRLGYKVHDRTLNGIIDALSDNTDNLSLFFSYFEKLQPQIRWSQTCRLPQTTVLGHSMYVAVLTYFCVKELGFKQNESQILVNSFFAALFHDLPESLTRDIISPVKRKIQNLEEQLSVYEYNEVMEKMISKITDKEWRNDFLYLLGKNNENKFTPFVDREFVLGRLIETVDKTAAFIEATMSVELGIDSEELQKGIKYTSSKIMNASFNYNVEWGSCTKSLYFNDFLASIPQYTEGISKDD